MTVRLTVKLNGNPLRHTYVSHFEFFRAPQTLFFQTDDGGRVTIENAGNANVTADPGGPNGEIKVRVYAQNSVVRVLDGSLPVPIEVSQEFTVVNNGSININTAAEQKDHFRVMDLCLDAYETVFQQFRPFNRPNRGPNPFGRGNSILATRDLLPRIEVSYPDRSVGQTHWVEPASLGTGFPLLHLREGGFNSIPHEMAHALYFALMPAATRVSVEAQYLQWLTTRVAAGLPPFHNTLAATSPFVAWIESFGLFGERFYRFAKQHPELNGVELRRAFFRNQLTDAPAGGAPVAKLIDNAVVANCTGDDVEGAIFGALFVDLARRIGLRETVGLFLESADNSVLQFDDLRNLIVNETDFDQALMAVVQTWQL